MSVNEIRSVMKLRQDYEQQLHSLAIVLREGLDKLEELATQCEEFEDEEQRLERLWNLVNG